MNGDEDLPQCVYRVCRHNSATSTPRRSNEQFVLRVRHATCSSFRLTALWIVIASDKSFCLRPACLPEMSSPFSTALPLQVYPPPTDARR